MIPGLERSPGEGKGSPLQYSGLENSMDCTVNGVSKSQTRLSDFHSLTQMSRMQPWKDTYLFSQVGEMKCAVLSRSVVSDSDCSPPGSSVHRGFSRQEYFSGLPCPPPGDLPNPGIRPRSPALQVDSLPAEPPGKPKNTGVGSLSLLPQIFPTQEMNWGLLHCRQIEVKYTNVKLMRLFHRQKYQG